MANWHILESDGGGNYRVAFHLPVPATQNKAGFTWQKALLNSGTAPATVMAQGNDAGQITAAEAGLVATAAMLEVVETHALGIGNDVPHVTVFLDARHAVIASERVGGLEKSLDLFGAVKK